MFSSLVGVGYASHLIICFSASSYIVILAWAFFYLFSSFSAELPWVNCDNIWNTGQSNLQDFWCQNNVDVSLYTGNQKFYTLNAWKNVLKFIRWVLNLTIYQMMQFPWNHNTHLSVVFKLFSWICSVDYTEISYSHKKWLKGLVNVQGLCLVEVWGVLMACTVSLLRLLHGLH